MLEEHRDKTLSTDEVKASFYDVVTSIESTSDDVVKALGRIELTLSNNASNHILPPKEAKQAINAKPVAKVFNPMDSVVSSNSDFSSVKRKKRKPKSTDTVKVEAISDSISHDAINSEQDDVVDSINDSPEQAAIVNVDNDFPDDYASKKDAKKQQELTNKTNALLEDLWKDTNGRLRDKSGAFASQQQKELFEKMQPSDQDDSEEKKGKSKILSLLSTWSDAKQDSAVNAVGSSGGVYWSVAMEVKDLATSASDSYTDIKENVLKSSKDSESKFHKFNSGIVNFFSSSKSNTSEAVDTEGAQESEKKPDLTLSSQLSEKDDEDDERLDEMVDLQSKTIVAINELKDELDGLGGASAVGGSIMDEFSGFGDSDKESRKGRKKGNKFKRFGRFGKPMASVADTGKNILSSSSKALKVGGSILGKLAVPLAGVVAGVNRYNEVKEDKTLTDNQKAVQVASTSTGALGGALGGAAAGAFAGSAIPIVGTLIGGLIGAAVGGWLGSEAGDVVGEAISNKMEPVVADDISASVVESNSSKVIADKSTSENNLAKSNKGNSVNEDGKVANTDSSKSTDNTHSDSEAKTDTSTRNDVELANNSDNKTESLTDTSTRNDVESLANTNTHNSTESANNSDNKTESLTDTSTRNDVESASNSNNKTESLTETTTRNDIESLNNINTHNSTESANNSENKAESLTDTTTRNDVESLTNTNTHNSTESANSSDSKTEAVFNTSTHNNTESVSDTTTRNSIESVNSSDSKVEAVSDTSTRNDVRSANSSDSKTEATNNTGNKSDIASISKALEVKASNKGKGVSYQTSTSTNADAFYSQEMKLTNESDSSIFDRRIDEQLRIKSLMEKESQQSLEKALVNEQSNTENLTHTKLIESKSLNDRSPLTKSETKKKTTAAYSYSESNGAPIQISIGKPSTSVVTESVSEAINANTNTGVENNNSKKEVVAMVDPKLTKALNELAKSNNAKSDKAKPANNSNHKTRKQSGSAGMVSIPTGFQDTNLKLIALDAD